MTHVLPEFHAVFEVSTEAATQMAMTASREAQYYEKPSHLFERGWKHLESAQWLTEYALRGEHSLIDDDLPTRLYEGGIDTIKMSLSGSQDQQVYHKYINVLMAHRALRWLCVERREKGMPVEKLYDAYLEDITTSLGLRHERSHREYGNSRTTAKRKDTIRTDYGFLLEAMLLGVVAESEEFRKARILGLPASPAQEAASDEIQLPPDIVLWKIEEDNTAHPIGGIQSKTKRKGATIDPHGFTATFIARTELDTRTNQEVINDWLEGKNLQSVHYRLSQAIVRSGNLALSNALGLTASEDVREFTAEEQGLDVLSN
jgi:hypothetical protein